MDYVTENAARKSALDALLGQTGWAGADLAPIPSDCSFRRYLRVRKGAETRIVMDAPPALCESIAPFVEIDRILINFHLKAPDIYAFDADAGLAVMEDMGRDSFTAVLAARPLEEMRLYEHAVCALEQIERCAAPAGVPEYSRELLRKEAHLPIEWYFSRVIGARDLAQATDDYIALWEKLLPLAEPESPVLVHRDYHADNLMWLPNASGAAKVGMLDFQDAVIGHPAYDLASLLEDVRRIVSDKVIDALLERRAARFTPAQQKIFARDYALFSAQRNCKILGIFARMALLYGKPSYLRLLPNTWRALERAMRHDALSELRSWCDAYFPPAVRMGAELKASA